MYLDAFEDNKDCVLEGKTYPHGSDVCDERKEHCQICIDGWLVDKVRGHRDFCAF